MSDYSWAGFSKSDIQPEVTETIKDKLLSGEITKDPNANEDFDFMVPGDLEIRIKDLGKNDCIGIELRLIDPENQKPLIDFGKWQIQIDSSLILVGGTQWPVKLTSN